MTISPITSAALCPPAVAAAEEATSQDEPEAVAARDEAAAEPEPKGVLRLLMAGHFKGVADVRLRINFHDQIAAAEAAAAKPAVNDAVTDLTGSVNAHLDQLASSGALDEGQRSALAGAGEAFDQAVAGASEAFLAASGVRGEGLKADLREAFDSLTGAMESVVAALAAPPAVVAPPAEPLPGDANGDGAVDGADYTAWADHYGVVPVPPASEGGQAFGNFNEDSTVDGADYTAWADNYAPAGGPSPVRETEPPFDFGAWLGSLQEAFAAAMLSVDEALASGSLPEPSPAPGKGVAYEKFLAIYKELRSPGSEQQRVRLEAASVEA